MAKYTLKDVEKAMAEEQARAAALAESTVLVQTALFGLMDEAGKVVKEHVYKDKKTGETLGKGPYIPATLVRNKKAGTTATIYTRWNKGEEKATVCVRGDLFGTRGTKKDRTVLEL